MSAFGQFFVDLWQNLPLIIEKAVEVIGTIGRVLASVLTLLAQA